MTTPTGAKGSPHDIAPPASGMTALASGRGPTLVLVHGALGDYRQWDAIVARLRPRFRVVAVSRRHHWPNEPPTAASTYSVESHRDDLLALLRSIDAPVHLVGHSYGVLVALAVALAEPLRLRTITLIEPPLPSLLPAGAPGLTRENASRAAMVATLRAQSSAGQDEAACITMIDWAQGGAGGYAALPDDSRRQLRANACTIGPTYATSAPQFACAQLERLRVPTLVLNGAETRLFYRLSGQVAAACIPGARSAEIPGTRHMVIVEDPDATAAAMLEFLAPLQHSPDA